MDKQTSEQLLLKLSKITSETVGPAKRGQYVINAIEYYSRKLHQDAGRPDCWMDQEWLDCASKCLAAIEGGRRES